MKQRQVTNLFQLRLICCILLLCYAFWLGQKHIFAADVTLFADDFNTAMSLSRWQKKHSQQLAHPQQPCLNRITPAEWIVGGGVITLTLDSPPCFIDFVPSMLDLRGILSYSIDLSFILREDLQMDRALAFLWQDPRNWYNLKFFGTSLLLEKVIDGTSYVLPGNLKHFPFQVNRTHQLHVEVTQQQQIKVWINQQLVLDVQDQPPFLKPLSPHTISLRGSVGLVSRSVTSIDDFAVRATLPSGSFFSLNVPQYKQHDARWKSQEYDHASSWTTTPTMERWGCAVSSMAMILNFHGINILPSGEQLTPETLNAWLKNQVDGYLQGGVNWLAVTRLTQLVSQQLGTPKLEFRRQDGTPQQIQAIAQQDIQANKPVILSYPGHFLVADGADSHTNTLLIKDPYYAYQNLLEHHSGTRIDSIRRFQPSHTDLSYFLFVVPETVEIELRDSMGKVLPTETVTEYLEDPTSTTELPNRSPVQKQLLFAQPSSGTYSVHLSQPEDGEYSLTMYTYDSQGNVAVHHDSGVITAEGKSIELAFQKEPPTTSPTPVPSSTPLQPSSPIPTPIPQQTAPPQLPTRLLHQLLRQQQYIIAQLQSLHKKLRSPTSHFRLPRIDHFFSW